MTKTWTEVKQARVASRPMPCDCGRCHEHPWTMYAKPFFASVAKPGSPFAHAALLPSQPLRLDRLALAAIRYEFSAPPGQQDDRRREIEDATARSCNEWFARTMPDATRAEWEWEREA